MAILIIQQIGSTKAGTLSGRVLIGRWPDNTIVLDDRAVSRVHAWIGVQDGQYYVADTGSRTGTIVNGALLRGRHILSPGDQIQIGPAVISFRDDPLPGDTEQIDLAPLLAARLSSATGDLLECSCGAPLWLPRGHQGTPRCRYCGHSVKRLLKKLVPARLPEEKRPEETLVQDKPPVVLRIDAALACGICHSPITAFDTVTDCGSCGLPFHIECWEENHGCSAYGCDQVGVLDRRNAG